MENDIKRSYEVTMKVMGMITNTNNHVIKETENLKLILLNLKIQNAHLHESSGIDPIAKKLEQTINSLHDNVQELVNGHREELATSLKEIKEYIEEKEGE